MTRTHKIAIAVGSVALVGAAALIVTRTSAPEPESRYDVESRERKQRKDQRAREREARRERKASLRQYRRWRSEM